MSNAKIVFTDQEINGVKQVELHIDGDFECSWDTFTGNFTDTDIGKIQNMLKMAIEFGEQKQKKALREFMGIHQ